MEDFGGKNGGGKKGGSGKRGGGGKGAKGAGVTRLNVSAPFLMKARADLAKQEHQLSDKVRKRAEREDVDDEGDDFYDAEVIGEDGKQLSDFDQRMVEKLKETKRAEEAKRRQEEADRDKPLLFKMSKQREAQLQAKKEAEKAEMEERRKEAEAARIKKIQEDQFRNRPDFYWKLPSHMQEFFDKCQDMKVCFSYNGEKGCSNETWSEESKGVGSMPGSADGAPVGPATSSGSIACLKCKFGWHRRLEKPKAAKSSMMEPAKKKAKVTLNYDSDIDDDDDDSN